MNILIQGGLYEKFTEAVAHQYAEYSLVDKVIISTWENEDIDENSLKSDKIVLLKSKMPDNNGPGNMNLQLVSSRNGLELCDDGLVMKTRTDQHLYEESLHTWMEHFKKNEFANTLRYADGEKQRSKIFLVGNNKRFPFHPQDHFFWGYKQDLHRLLNIPLWDVPAWTWRDAPINFSEKLRPNIYIGINYYKQFFPEIEKYFLNQQEYLLDGSPKYEEAMDFYTPIRDSIFAPMPRVDMWWAKQGTGYWYSYEKEGEYYAD